MLSAAWCVATIAVLALFFWLALRFEFDRRFDSRCFGLRPADLDDPAYAQCLRHLIDIRAVRKYRVGYALGSVVAIAVLAGFVACVPAIRAAIGKVTPPLIFDFYLRLISGTNDLGVEHNRAATVFYSAMFFAAVLHLPQALILFFAPSGSAASKQPFVPEHSVMRLLTASILIQEYVLDRMIGNLLRDHVDRNEKPNQPYLGSSARVLKGVVAKLMATECSKELIDRAYEDVVDGFGSLPGEGVAAVTKTDLTGLSELHKVMTLINRESIPEARRRLDWRIKRQSLRRSTNHGIAILLKRSNSSRDAVVPDSWIENIGKQAGAKSWNSMLIRIPMPNLDIADPKELHGAKVIISELRGSPLDPPLTFKVVRAESPVESTSGANRYLDLGCIVQEPDIARFSNFATSLQDLTPSR